MKKATLCLLVKGKPVKEILLGLKKRGFGVGKYNGFGGKVEKGETVTKAAAREVYEESGIKVREEDLQRAGTIEFQFPAMPVSNFIAYIFITDKWQGKGKETEEMLPELFCVDEIPYQQMWQDDKLWLPDVLRGKSINAICIFAADNESLAEFKKQD